MKREIAEELMSPDAWAPPWMTDWVNGCSTEVVVSLSKLLGSVLNEGAFGVWRIDAPNDDDV